VRAAAGILSWKNQARVDLQGQAKDLGILQEKRQVPGAVSTPSKISP
jgi:hypothetical protein